MRTPRPLVPLLVAALAGAGILYGASLAPGRASAAAPPASSDAGVSVAGVGTAGATPDVVRTSLGAETSAATVDEALGAANEATRRVVDALRGAGVAERDIQTAGVQLYPQYGPEGQQGGYTARQDLTVVLRDLETAGAVIGAAVEAGGDAARLSGVSFGLADETAVRAQAREEALADARAKAEQYAELAGRELGELVSVREDAGTSSPGYGGDSGESASAALADVQLAPGTAEVTVTAQVRWSLE